LFKSFLLIFQTEAPLIHLLHRSMTEWRLSF
jgi:hypothetical protein